METGSVQSGSAARSGASCRACLRSSAALRVLAMALMLADHLWLTGHLQSSWWNALGRLAFPIFAYQLVQGIHHTRSLRRYAGRLALAALVSELPFNLMLSGRLLFPARQNVMVTLLLGLLAVHAVQQMAQPERQQRGFFSLAAVLVLSLAACPDYGVAGVATVLLFELTKPLSHALLWQLAGMLLIHGAAMGSPPLPIVLGPLTVCIPIQTFAAAALIPIGLSTDEKGPGGPLFRLLCYVFYPAHMLVLALL